MHDRKGYGCRQGDNVVSAGNQQERLNSYWISGFVDGEGCFHVAINKLPKMTLGYQVLPEFRVAQHKRDLKVLKEIQRTLKVGVVRKNHEDIYELRVRSLEELNKLVAFFERFPLKTKKKSDFELFTEVVQLMNEGAHLTEQGIKKIAQKASEMNRKTERVMFRIPRDYTPDAR